jgi:outer membrane protein
MNRWVFAGCVFLVTGSLAHGAAAGNPMTDGLQARPDAEVRTEDEPGLRFTLKQAEGYALANHPQIAAARFNADAVRQEIRQARSEFFPQVYGESDSVYAPSGTPGTRLAAINGLNNPSVFSRQSDGVTVSQLITDFGRTYDLTESAHFRADAAQDRTNVARAMVVLEVDRAYFGLLQARAVERVARQTVEARQVAYHQISVLAKNQLKSILDANFAQVNLSEAQLLLIQAQSGVSDAEAELSTALGFSDAQHFMLTEEPLDQQLPASPEDLIREAMAQRPELASLRNEREASQRFAQAQDAAQYPKITALGAAGVNPVADSADFKRTYYTAGVNVEIPVFNGGNLDAKAQEAHLLTKAAVENLVEAQNTISRDVRMAWLAANTARQRLGVTQQLIQSAAQEQQLAEARYRLGTSSIVELIQAQLDDTEAQLQDTSARYDYQSGRALLRFTIGGNF